MLNVGRPVPAEVRAVCVCSEEIRYCRGRRIRGDALKKATLSLDVAGSDLRPQMGLSPSKCVRRYCSRRAYVTSKAIAASSTGFPQTRDSKYFTDQIKKKKKEEKGKRTDIKLFPGVVYSKWEVIHRPVRKT